MAGFPTEMNLFLARHEELRRRFDVTFEFPDYTCQELAEIFVDLVHAKGFYLDETVRVDYIANLLQKKTAANWRGERNGRVSEMLLAGARTEVRKRIRSSQYEEQAVDPQLILRRDIETAMEHDLK
jgi:SpoVK/Ycf46/Vps4 family AAA+-type ATPase